MDLIDVAHISWSPCGRYLALVESALFNYRVEIWTPTGVKLGAYWPMKTHFDPTGSVSHLAGHGRSDFARRRQASSNENLDEKNEVDALDESLVAEGYVGLGIRHVKWRPGGDYLAVGGWDSKVGAINRMPT